MLVPCGVLLQSIDKESDRKSQTVEWSEGRAPYLGQSGKFPRADGVN